MAFLLAGIISCSAFYNVGVLGYWLANRTYITSNLCENRTRPQLHCNGKCYLKKKLAVAGIPVSSDNSSLPSLKKGLELAECPDGVAALSLMTESRLSVTLLPERDGRCTTGFPDLVFHPPARRT